MIGRLLTAREVAERLRLTPATVVRYVREGKLPAIRLPSGAMRFREDEIEQRLEQWTRGTAPQDRKEDQ